jgi:hypothetical protein
MPPTPQSQKKQYRFVGGHATELQVGDARPWVGEGDFIDLSSEDVNDEKIKELIDSGMLVDVVETNQAGQAEVKAAAKEQAQAQAETGVEASSDDEGKEGGK